MATAALAGPRKSFSLGRHLALSSFWFGGNYHWGPILPILLPFQILRLHPDQPGSALGLVLGVGAFFAMVLPPLVGHWSDGITTRFGRRRPVIIAGTAANVVGLFLLMVAPNYLFLFLAYQLVQISNNTAGAGFNALVPDVVPKQEFGRQSGILGGMVQLGTIGGLATYIVLARSGFPLLTYVAIAVVLVLTLIPTIAAAGNEGTTPLPPRPARPLRESIREFLSPLWSGDFSWVIFTRMMATGGVWCVFPFLQFFFAQVSKIPNADQFTSAWELVVLLAATPMGIAGGWLSDRFGRKRFVYVSGALQGLVLVVFVVLYPSQVWLLFALGVLFGLGYGLYYAVDYALACDTLPDPDRAAKDMGLFHVAWTFPQVVLPGVLGFVLDASNRASPNSGFRVIFSVGTVFFLLSTLLVSRIKSVR